MRGTRHGEQHQKPWPGPSRAHQHPTPERLRNSCHAFCRCNSEDVVDIPAARPLCDCSQQGEPLSCAHKRDARNCISDLQVDPLLRDGSVGRVNTVLALAVQLRGDGVAGALSGVFFIARMARPRSLPARRKLA